MAKTIESQLVKGLKDFESKMDKLGLEDRETKKFLRAELTPVLRDAKKLVPKPGYPGDKPEHKALRDGLRIVTRGYADNWTWYGAVGALYPGFAHAHLVHGWKRERTHGAKGGHAADAKAVVPKGMTVTKFLEKAWNRHVAAMKRSLEQYVGRAIIKGVKR